MREQNKRENPTQGKLIQGKARRRQRAARKRTGTAAVCIFLLIPLTIAGGIAAGSRWYLPVSLLVLAETMAPFFLIYENRGRRPGRL